MNKKTLLDYKMRAIYSVMLAIMLGMLLLFAYHEIRDTRDYSLMLQDNLCHFN